MYIMFVENIILRLFRLKIQLYPKLNVKFKWTLILFADYVLFDNTFR